MPVDAFRPKVSSRGGATRDPEVLLLVLILPFASSSVLIRVHLWLPFAFAFAFSSAFICVHLRSSLLTPAEPAP